MIDEEWIDRKTRDKSASGGKTHPDLCGKTSINGWQIAGGFLLFFLFSPALVTGIADDWTEGLGLTLLTSPLLAWLFIPLRRSDDLFDETNHKRSEIVDALALVLLWTWPWTCTAPVVAIGRCIQRLLFGGL